MTPEEALAAVNEMLGIRGVVTVRGDEIKCWTQAEDEPGVTKTYLTRFDCAALADAFQVLAEALPERTG